MKRPLKRLAKKKEKRTAKRENVFQEADEVVASIRKREKKAKKGKKAQKKRFDAYRKQNQRETGKR